MTTDEAADQPTPPDFNPRKHIGDLLQPLVDGLQGPITNTLAAYVETLARNAFLAGFQAGQEAGHRAGFIAAGGFIPPRSPNAAAAFPHLGGKPVGMG